MRDQTLIHGLTVSRQENGIACASCLIGRQSPSLLACLSAAPLIVDPIAPLSRQANITHQAEVSETEAGTLHARQLLRAGSVGFSRIPILTVTLLPFKCSFRHLSSYAAGQSAFACSSTHESGPSFPDQHHRGGVKVR